MAGVREAILEAVERLERRTGQEAHSLKSIVTEVLTHDSSYLESTIRTYVVSVMCANAPVHHANHTNDLRRIDRGLYARMTDPKKASPEFRPADLESTRVDESQTEGPTDPGDDWFWEGGVQSAIVAGLVNGGWMIQSVSDTASRAQGTDIVATKAGERLHVEVKGYPSTKYARGANAGQAKPTHPATQARVWFSGALLKAAMLRGDYPEDLVAIGLPSFDTYRNLADRTSLTLRNAKIGLIWVDSSGDVSRQLLHHDDSSVP